MFYDTTSLETSKGKVRAVQNLHMDVNGWADVGYHFLVDKLGNIFEGRQGSMTSIPRGAHDGANNSSFGFSTLGYFHPTYDQFPTPELRNALYDVIAWRMRSGWSPYGSGSYNGATVGFLDGHRVVKATACPGDRWYFPYITSNVSAGESRNDISVRRGGSAPAVPAVPSGLNATAVSTTQIDLSWSDNSNNEDVFVIFRSLTPGGPYTEVGGTAANTTLYSDKGLTSGTTYYYVVRAKNSGGSSANSAEASATATPPPPGGPEIIIDNGDATVVGSWSTGTSATDKYGADYRFKSAGTGSAYLQYTPNISTAGDYQIYCWYPQGANRPTDAPYTITYNGGTTTVSVNQQANGGGWRLLGTFNFATGTAGHVRITDNFTTPSAVVMADAVRFVSVAPPSIPDAPNGLNATPGNAQVSLSWTASSGATSYNVKRSTTSGGPYTTIASPTGTSYTDTSVVNGTTYYYVVSAVNSAGESANSSQVSATPQAPATILVHVQSITMSWVPSGSKFKSRAVVRVVDASNAPVSGATVTGNFTGSINNSGLSGVTDANGDATITSTSSIKNGTVTFTVTNITGSNMTYDSAANVVTSATHSR